MILAFLLPALALYTLFVLYPITQSIRYSGYDWNGLEPLTDWVGFQNFKDAFYDPLFIEAITHNGIIIGLSLLLQIPFAVALAVLLSRNLKGHGVFPDDVLRPLHPLRSGHRGGVAPDLSARGPLRPGLGRSGPAT